MATKARRAGPRVLDHSSNPIPPLHVCLHREMKGRIVAMLRCLAQGDAVLILLSLMNTPGKGLGE